MKKTGAKILVNAITMTRVIGAFLMPIVSAKFTAEELVAYIIVLLLTDTPDGLLARRFNVSTLFGALLDALADKLLTLSTLIVLARLYPIMWLPIGIEIIITLININSGVRGTNVESSMLGKIKTWILGVCTVFGFITVFADDFINLFDNTTTIGICLINVFKYIGKRSKIFITIIALITTISSSIVAINYFIFNYKEISENKKMGFDSKKYKIKTGKELKEALFSTEFYEKTKNEPVLVKLGKVEE